ncbi:uncharacterized protein ISCGN_029890 [Ixodes scapularis]
MAKKNAEKVKRLAKEVLRSIENTSAKSRICKKSPAALTEEKEKKEDAVVEVIESMDSPGRDPASTPFLRRRRRAPSKRQSNEAATAGASHADLARKVQSPDYMLGGLLLSSMQELHILGGIIAAITRFQPSRG